MKVKKRYGSNKEKVDREERGGTNLSAWAKKMKGYDPDGEKAIAISTRMRLIDEMEKHDPGGKKAHELAKKYR
ncbi:MAG: hypothetical protein WC587_01765 [Candidatus Paceibacterota bacterium]